MQENAMCAGCNQKLVLQIPKEMPSPEAERWAPLRRYWNDPLWFMYHCPHCKEANMLTGWGYEFKDGQKSGPFLFSERHERYAERRRETIGQMSLAMLDVVFENSLICSWITTCITLFICSAVSNSFSVMMISCGAVFGVPILAALFEALFCKIPNVSPGLGAFFLSMAWWLLLCALGSKAEIIVGASNLFFWWFAMGLAEYISQQKSTATQLSDELSRVQVVHVLDEGAPYRS
jgi:hypothetical protein